MYSKLPNLVIGFHGCSNRTYEKVINKNQKLDPSTNTYDWLGNGIYFWESNYQRAMEWAIEQVARGKYDIPKVIGAVIDLGYSLNLTDSAYIPMLQRGYELLKLRCESNSDVIPRNKGGSDLLLRELDCAVIEQIHDYNLIMRNRDESSNVQEFDSVRGFFIEGKEVYEGSGFREKTHIQICVRNPNCIKGYFCPLEPNKDYVIP